jgi:hypothetical protein
LFFIDNFFYSYPLKKFILFLFRNIIRRQWWLFVALLFGAQIKILKLKTYSNNNFQNLTYFFIIQDLCRINNSMLVALGVGHPKVDQICTLLARYGIHPKMTGAGGGGSVFAFLKPDTPSTIISMIKDELAKLDYDMWQPPLGGCGVMLHSIKPDVFVAADRATTGPVSSRSTTPAGSNTPAGSHQSTPAARHKK